jgi:hypothetical protein
MDKFIIFNKEEFMYALCINKVVEQIYIDKFITIGYLDTFEIKQENNIYCLLHNKYKKEDTEILLEEENILIIIDYFKSIINNYINEMNNTLNILD